MKKLNLQPDNISYNTKSNIIEFFKKNYLYISAGIIILVIGILITWPLINKGKLLIHSNQSSTKAYICNTADIVHQEGYSNCPFLDSKIEFYSQTQNTFLSLPPGNYSLVIKKENYLDFQKDFIVYFWQTTNIDANLIPSIKEKTQNIVIGLQNNSINNTPHYIEQITIFDEANSSFSNKFQFKKIENNQETIIFETNEFKNIKDISWSPNFNKVIFNGTENDETLEKKYYLDIVTQKIINSTIPSDKIAWSKDSEKIYYIFQNQTIDETSIPDPDMPSGGRGWAPVYTEGENHNSLTIANPDGSQWQNIYKLPSKILNPEIKITTDNTKLAIISQDHTAFIFHFENNLIEEIPAIRTITDISWSPDDETLLAEIIDNKGLPSIEFIRKNDNNDIYFRPLFIKSFIKKLTWISNTEFILAIPTYLPTITPGDYPNSTDQFYYFDTSRKSDSIQNDTIFSTNFDQKQQGANSIDSLAFDPSSFTLYFTDMENYLYTLKKDN